MTEETSLSHEDPKARSSQRVSAGRDIESLSEKKVEDFGDYEEKDVKEFIKNVIEEDLEMCKVCGGSHGNWLDRDDFVKKFKKRAGEKLLT